MAFDWATVLVAPTGSSGLDSGDHTSVDETPPWNDSDTASETVTNGATETAIFNGFDLSVGPGEKKGFQIWARLRCTNAAGFDVSIVLKQDTTTLWTGTTFTLTNTSFKTFVIPIADSVFVGSDIDNLSIEFTVTNLLGSNQSFHVSFLRISKSPFTTAEEASLPASLDGQDFVCYRSSDLAVLGAVDGESVILIPDASGKGRHAILVAGTAATYQTDAPEGIETSATRYVGSLGFDTATEAPIRWSDNKVFHGQVYPTSLTTDHVVFSIDNQEFIGSSSADKHLMGVNAVVDWVMMSGDGSGPAHLIGGAPATDTEARLTEWVQISGGNEHMWLDDDASPFIDASSGDNPFGSWSLLNRESDNRPWIGRVRSVWFVEGTGISEADIDDARDEWVNGPSDPTIIELHARTVLRIF